MKTVSIRRCAAIAGFAALAALATLPTIVGNCHDHDLTGRWQGFCATRHGFSGNWKGPVRDTYALAAADAREHEKQFGHSTDVMGGSACNSSLLAHAYAKTFEFEVECQMKCKDDRCERVCAVGTVFALNTKAVDLGARAKIRQEVSSRGGTVVESSVSVKIKVLD